MAYELKHRRGTAAASATFTGAEGEITYKTDTKQLVVHDGVTPGGTTLNDAANITYTPAGTGAVATTVQGKLRETVSVFDFMTAEQIADVQSGAASIDVSAAIIEALNTSKPVYAPPGVYRITQPLSNTTTSNIHLTGAAFAYLSHRTLISNTNSSSYTDLPPAGMEKEFTVFLCDGCSLIGAEDTGTMNASDKLRSLKNCVVWAKNNAPIGVYVKNQDTLIDGVTLALFKNFGILSRAQITSVYGAICTVDCGWGLASSGSTGYPGTYYSGCGMMLASNVTAGDYSTISPSYRPTSLEMRGPFFFWVRNHTITTKSGLRGLQAFGLLSGNINSLGGYTGSYFNICTGTNINGYHVENYSTSGLSAGDATPKALYFANSNVVLGHGYMANISAGAIDPLGELDSNVAGIPHNVIRPQGGMLLADLTLRPSKRQTVTVGTPGSTVSYTFSNIAQSDLAIGGIVCVSLVKKAAYTDWAKGFFLVSTHKAGGSGWQPMTSVSLSATSSAGLASGPYQGTIGAPTWSSGDLLIPITWGGLWAAGTEFYLDVAVFGCAPASI